MISESLWDSRLINGKAGKISSPFDIPDKSELKCFNWVAVKISQDEIDLIKEYQNIGFYYVTVEFLLQHNGFSIQSSLESIYRSLILSKEELNLRVSGFNMEYSRIMIDPIIRKYVCKDLWDKMIIEHAESFADFVICIVHEDALGGVASCFDNDGDFEIFWLQVHPDYYNKQIGTHLLSMAKCIADSKCKELRTSVINNNIKGMNFYIKNGFVIEEGQVVLHYWNNLL